ncbi:hypothetical protein ACFY1U_43890 [Streptomyces sp. NPDC001351]|uniref:hypothetical protein n=1 Tax=Streptomyces sp. NPDC001351 TaxID=3364564 RepID=UPI0036CCE30A
MWRPVVFPRRRPRTPCGAGFRHRTGPRASSRPPTSPSACPDACHAERRRIARSGLITHLVEQPTVASDAARFRLQAMADHTNDDLDTTIGILDTCIRAARQAIATRR